MDRIDEAADQLAQLVLELEVLAEGWRQLASHIRETDRHSPTANELDNCADDLTGTYALYAPSLGEGQ